MFFLQLDFVVPIVDFSTIPYTSVRVIVIIQATDCMGIYNGNYVARGIVDTHLDPSVCEMHN